MSDKNRWAWVWPDIIDIESAKKANLQGYWASLWIAGITALFASTTILGHSLLGIGVDSFADAGIFLIVAWGIKRQSRTAAVAGLLIYLVERIYMWSIDGPKNPVMAILITLMFGNSIRGTFAFHNFIGTRINVKNIIFKHFIALLFTVFLLGISFIVVALTVDNIDTVPDYIYGLLLIGPLFISLVCSLRGWLPFTKNRKIIFIPGKTTNELLEDS